MKMRLTALAAALISCSAPAWANTANVDIYGVMNVNIGFPAYETYSAAADIGTNFFTYDPTYTPLLDVTNTSGATAQISATSYTASASTTLGSNHAYATASAFPSNVMGAGSFSGWYDQVTITGGTGTGTAYFTVQLSGIVDVGAYSGGMAYALGTSSVHPSQLVSDSFTFNVTSPYSWPMDAVAPITTYLLGASPYNDTSILFPVTYPTDTSITGIPALTDPSYSLGGDTGMGFPTADQILTPGAGQSVNVTLLGTLNFTYGESFYLLSGLGVNVLGDGLESFCAFPTTIGDTCSAPAPVKDGTGATTLDFSNSANLVGIGLPVGATATFASGTTYNVTAVPEPGEWLMLLAGLGLVGWRVRSRA